MSVFKKLRDGLSSIMSKAEEEKSVNLVSPSEYFNILKAKKETITDEKLQEVYENCFYLINKFERTGQKDAIKKVLFHLDCIEKERQLIKLGITTFIYRTDIEYYLDNVQNRVVKIIELKDYEREVPEDITKIVEKTRDIFDKMYVLFTDYTGKVEKQVEKKDREKDPILFGAFISSRYNAVVDRFYFLGDWEDKFCDLTLDKLVSEVKSMNGSNIEMHISTPEDLDELRKQLNLSVINSDGVAHLTASLSSDIGTVSSSTMVPRITIITNNNDAVSNPLPYVQDGEDISERVEETFDDAAEETEVQTDGD